MNFWENEMYWDLEVYLNFIMDYSLKDLDSDSWVGKTWVWQCLDISLVCNIFINKIRLLVYRALMFWVLKMRQGASSDGVGKQEPK